MFVSDDIEHVEIVRARARGDTWSTVTGGAGERVRLLSLGCDIDASSVYAGGAAPRV